MSESPDKADTKDAAAASISPLTVASESSNGTKRARRPIKTNSARKQAKIKDEQTVMFELEDGKTEAAGKIIYAQILHVQTQDPNATGYGIRVFGFAEKGMTQPLYDRNVDHNNQFMDDIGCVKKVVEHYKDDQPVFNKKKYQVKILVFSCDSTADEAILRQSFDDNFAPAYLNTCEDNRIWGRGKAPINIVCHGPYGYKTFTSWDQIVGPKDLVEVMQGITGRNFQDWIRTGKTQTYSAFRVGHVPADIKKQFGLTERHLDPADLSPPAARNLSADFDAKPAADADSANVI